MKRRQTFTAEQNVHSSPPAHAVPDVEGDGHHRVEDDDVGPEGEEGR